MSSIIKIRCLTTIILLLTFCSALPADRLVIKTGAELGNSFTTDFIGGGFVIPEWNVANNIKLSSGIMITNEKKTSVFMSNTVKILSRNYEFRITDKFLCNNYNSWNMQEFLFFTGLGATVRHFDGMLGISFRVMTRKDSYYKESIFEPFNFQYDMGMILFTQPKRWNIRLSISNYDVFLFERAENIIFSLKGNYRFSNRFSIFCTANLRPAGNFNLTANYYSFYMQIGIQWTIF